MERERDNSHMEGNGSRQNTNASTIEPHQGMGPITGTISSTHKKIAYKYKLQDNIDRSKRSRSDGTGKISKDSTAFP